MDFVADEIRHNYDLNSDNTMEPDETLMLLNFFDSSQAYYRGDPALQALVSKTWTFQKGAANDIRVLINALGHIVPVKIFLTLARGCWDNRRDKREKFWEDVVFHTTQCVACSDECMVMHGNAWVIQGSAGQCRLVWGTAG